MCRGLDQFCLRTKTQVQTAGLRDEPVGLFVWSREGSHVRSVLLILPWVAGSAKSGLCQRLR